MSIRFSVIVPTFNREAKLKRCLESLTDQHYSNFEVIVCDDGSTDNTKDIIEGFTKKLNIVYNYRQNWGGPAKPRNTGIELANGEYICFLDSDDWWLPDKLVVLNHHISPNFQVYYHSMLIKSNDRDHGLINCRQVNNINSKIDLLINLNTLPTSSVCIETKLLKGTQGFSQVKELIGLEDYDLWIRLGDFGAKFKFIDQCLGVYSIGAEDNITLEDRRQILKFDYLYNQYISNPSISVFKNKIKASLAFHTGRIIHDNKLKENYLKHYFYSLMNGSFRVKMMVIKRLIRF